MEEKRTPLSVLDNAFPLLPIGETQSEDFSNNLLLHLVPNMEFKCRYSLGYSGYMRRERTIIKVQKRSQILLSRNHKRETEPKRGSVIASLIQELRGGVYWIRHEENW